MIRRELYLNKIKPYINKNLIKVIRVVRRCGKSIILKQIVEELIKNGVNEENIILINLELTKLYGYKNYSSIR